MSPAVVVQQEWLLLMDSASVGPARRESPGFDRALAGERPKALRCHVRGEPPKVHDDQVAECCRKATVKSKRILRSRSAHLE